jgi:hypothetical protein
MWKKALVAFLDATEKDTLKEKRKTKKKYGRRIIKE